MTRRLIAEDNTMIAKKDLDKLLTLTRKWHREKDRTKADDYYDQARSLSRDIAKGTKFEHEDMVAGNHIFYLARLVAEKRMPNEQLYMRIEWAGEKVDGWE